MAMITMPDCITYEDASGLLADPVALRQQAERDGYLMFRGLIQTEPIRGLRRAVEEVLIAKGWLSADGRCPSDGPATYEGGAGWQPFYEHVQRLRCFHALPQHPALQAAMAVLFDAPVLTHPRHILRFVPPGCQRQTTPPHQDHFYIGGTPETWTAWIPLGDCPQSMGGLAVLPGSHKQGRLRVRPAEGAGGHGIQADDCSGTWRHGAMACGDVLLLHSHTVHQGVDNNESDLPRISVDCRFQSRYEMVAAASLRPHQEWQDWEHIYRGWPANDPLRYYWRSWDLRVEEV